jgi:hypothetical protein
VSVLLPKGSEEKPVIEAEGQPTSEEREIAANGVGTQS